MRHLLVRADPVPSSAGMEHLVWFYVACDCNSSRLWRVNYWTAKFNGPGDVGRGLYVDDLHRDWVCLLVTFLAFGYDDALARIQDLQRLGTPYEWAWAWLQLQGRQR